MAFVYIMTNRDNRVLYTGVTSDLNRRVLEHKNHIIEGFTDHNNCEKLLYYEEYGDIREAIQREKVLKRWNRKWKYDLIRKLNPEFRDLFDG